MHDDLDSLLARLALQPAPLRLNGLEAGVVQSIKAEPAAPGRTWRYAAVGLALVLGVGIGSAATSPWRSPARADLSGGVGSAPSSLLDASR